MESSISCDWKILKYFQIAAQNKTETLTKSIKLC